VARRRPHRQFTAALHALARAYAGTSHPALAEAAHSLVSVLTTQPLTHSPAVAATASRLRRALDPDRRPALTRDNPPRHRMKRLIPAGQRN